MKVRVSEIYGIGRYTEIERENRILLEKMSGIMQTAKPALYNPGIYKTLKGIGLISRKSLNRESRKKDLLKITIEN